MTDSKLLEGLRKDLENGQSIEEAGKKAGVSNPYLMLSCSLEQWEIVLTLAEIGLKERDK